MRIRPVFWFILAFSCSGVLTFAASLQTQTPAIMQVRLDQQTPLASRLHFKGILRFDTLFLNRYATLPNCYNIFCYVCMKNDVIMRSIHFSFNIFFQAIFTYSALIALEYHRIASGRMRRRYHKHTASGKSNT